MRISNLRIEGYRSLAQITWRPGALNVLIGPNASGKSNLLRVLEMISAAAEGRLASHVQSEGGVDAMLWDGQAKHLWISLRTKHPGPDDEPPFELTYELQLERLGNSGDFRFGLERLLVAFSDSDDWETILERSRQRASMRAPRGNKLVPVEGPLPDEETLLSAAAGPLGTDRLSFAFRQKLGRWRIYQELDTSSDSPVRRAVVARHDKTVNRDGQNLVQVLHTLYTEHREFKSEVHQAMVAAFGDEFEELVFAPAADQRIQMRVRWRSLHREQSAADLSDGTLRFLFLLAVLGNPAPPPLIAIDEPETGLHPSMLPIVAEYAVAASKKTQVIFSTHSPSFLDAFRDETPTTTVVEWKDGKTSFHVRTGDDLAYWLKEYSLGELYRTGELETVE